MMIRDKLFQKLQALSLVREMDPQFLVSIKSLSDDDFTFLAESVDDSDYSVQEWLIALDEFWKWNRAAGMQYKPRFQIEYLNCCVQGSIQGGGKLVSLADLFLDYANVYGVSGPT